MISPATIPSGFAIHALQLLQKVQHGISPVELIYTSHEKWPFRPGHATHTRPILRISVLDSSFNPPTLAHLALANASPPSRSSSQCPPATTISVEPYDARILLLSVRNADKVLRPGDATLVQRCEMIRLFSNDICSMKTSGGPSRMSDNVAIAVIDEPTFVGKSTSLLRFLQTRLAAVVDSNPLGSISGGRDESYPFPLPKLIFLLGFDTLLRLFSPKFYPSEQVMVQMLQTFFSSSQQDCRIVCAYRKSASTDKTVQETQVKGSDIAQEFITSDRIAFIDIGADEQTFSSSDVRAKVAAVDGKWRRLVTDAIASYITERGLYSDSERKQ